MKKAISLIFISGLLVLSALLRAGTELSITVNDDAFLKKWLNEMKAAYEKQNPDITIKINRVSSAGSDYHAKLAMTMPVETTQDVVWMLSTQYPTFLKGDFLSPIPEIKQWDGLKNYYPNIIDSFKVNGEYYAVPNHAIVIGLFYSKAIFKKAGLPVPWEPKTWQDIYDAASTIKQKIPGVWPVAFAAVPEEFTAFRSVLMFLYGTENPGAQSIYRDAKWVVTSKGLYDTYAFIDKLVKDNLTIPKSMLLTPVANDIEKKYIPEGKVAIDLDGCWIQRFWTGPNARVKDEYGFASFPTQYGKPPYHITVGVNWVFTISQRSAHKKEAAKFIMFLCNEKNSVRYSNIMSDLSPRMDVYQDPGFPSDLKVFMPTIKYTLIHPQSEQYPVIANELSVPIGEIVSGELSPEEAMEKFAESVELTVGKENVTREYNVKK